MKDSHGANIFELSRKYEFNIKEIKDFSSNINPLGPSKRALEHLKNNLHLVSTYPDSDYYGLKTEIAKYVDCEKEDIILGSGTTELFGSYIKMISPSRAMLISPCYSEYENELRKLECEIFYYNLVEENNFEVNIDNFISSIEDNEIDLVIFANPNNPTGTIFTQNDISKILQTNTQLLVDETYVEFTNSRVYSSIPLTRKYENLFVTRGVSKFFASPGIRLGYGITSNPKHKHILNKEAMLWNINIFADIMGKIMFSDKDYQREVFDFITSQREYMINELSKIKEIKVFKSEGNFVLCKILNDYNASDLREHLMTKAMVIRDCSSFKNLNEKFFRFCILEKEDNERLCREIKTYFED